MQERAFGDPKLSFAWNSEVVGIHGDAKVTGVTLRDTITGETREHPATGVFVTFFTMNRTGILSPTLPWTLPSALISSWNCVDWSGIVDPTPTSRTPGIAPISRLRRS